jgi:glycosyltransferase involved in cell wall biosynthesis
MFKGMVSICIPTYNGESYIKSAIESVLAQSYTNLELIIIDDASTDRTEEIVKEFNDNRIRFLRNNGNIGMVPNWNFCLDNANGQYIKILCHDDILAENCIEECVNIFEKHSDLSIVFSSTKIVNTQGRTIIRRRPYQSDLHLDGLETARKSFRLKNLYGEPSNVLFKKASMEAVGHFEEGLCYSIDWHYWIMLSLVGNAFYIDQDLTSFRVSQTSATSSLMKRKSILRMDDNLFIKKCLENEQLNIRKSDILLHKFNIFIRTYARELFFALQAKNNYSTK